MLEIIKRLMHPPQGIVISISQNFLKNFDYRYYLLTVYASQQQLPDKETR